MNKQEFLAALRAGLSGLSEQEIHLSVDFYREIIEDHMEDGLAEEAAVAAVGSVEEIVGCIRAESQPPNHTNTHTQNQAVALNSCVVNQPFSNIAIDSADCTIRLLPATDGACRVSYRHLAQVGHIITVGQDTLTIRQQDKRSWLERLRGNWGGGEIEVYLPGTVYRNLNIRTASGTVEIPNNFVFDSAILHVVSGNVSCSGGVRERLEVKTVSGRISLEGLCSPCLQLWAKTISGHIELIRISCDSLTATSTSGAMKFTSLAAEASLRATNISGKMVLTDCDAGSLELKTISGRISANLRTPKVFSAHSVSGQVSVPPTSSGGPCKITTTSGSITCTIQ